MSFLNFKTLRLWHWRMLHLWSVIRLRRRVILLSIIVGMVVAIVITMKTTHVYLGHVTLDPNSNPDPNEAR